MKIVFRSIIFIGVLLFVFIAYSKSDNTFKKHQDQSISEQLETTIDTALYFEVDDYPISNEMLKDKNSNSSLNEVVSRKIYSLDKVWFTNSELSETIVMELYTDYHRMITFHFKNNDIPENLIDQFEFHTLNKNTYEVLQHQQEKTIALKDFMTQSKIIDSKYFVSNQQVKLGDSKQKMLSKYCIPDSTKIENGFEEYYWTFEGDEITKKSNKKIASQSFGHSVILYFKNDKLVGQILKNDIP